MKRRSLLISVLAICATAYWGAERGAYHANYYWAKIADARKVKKDAELEQKQNRDAAELRDMIAKGLDVKSKERWDKYDQCVRLGAVKAGQPGAGELVLSAYIPTWMQYCLTGTIESPKIRSSSAPEAQ